MGFINFIYDYFNYINIIGMGEVIFVLNGIEFRICYNDYKFCMLYLNFIIYYVIVDIFFFDVFLLVKS